MRSPRCVTPILVSVLAGTLWGCLTFVPIQGDPPDPQLLPLDPDELDPAVASAGEEVLLVLNLVTSREVEVVIAEQVVGGFADQRGEVLITLPSSLTDGIQQVIVRDPETKDTLEQGYICINICR